MSTRVLLTGVTGALGSALLPELLGRGFEVYCLIRPQKNEGAAARLRRLTANRCAIPLAGDITDPLCGVDPAKLPKIDKLVHAAADTSLSQGNEQRAVESNLVGTRNALALAAALGNPEFYYIGTAYIAGDAPVLTEHDAGGPLTVGKSRNPYEASKVQAETMVRQYRGQYSVLRPSIVVGRSDDGAAPGLDGIYGFFRSITRLREMIRRGNYTDEKGLRIGRGYNLQIPIGIKDQDDIALNLVQLDWISETEAALIALPAQGRTYNLTHPNSMRLKALVRTTIDALDLAHVSIVEDKGGWTLSPIKIAIRRMVNRELEHLRPYLLHSPLFESRNLYSDLGPDWPMPPPITTEFIRMTMSAADNEWTDRAAIDARA